MKKFTHKKWTQNELNFLEDNCGFMSTPELAIALNRTEQSIKYCRERHNISRYDNFYTLNSLQYDIGMNRETLRRYVLKGMLNTKKTSWMNGRRRPNIILDKDVNCFIRKCWYKLDQDKIINPKFLRIYKLCKKESINEQQDTTTN